MSQTAPKNLRRYEYSEDLLAGAYKGKILSNLLILVLWQLSELLNLQVYKKATAYLGSWIELSTVGDKKKQTFTIIKQSVRIFLCPMVHFLCGPKQKRILPSLVLSHAFPDNFELKITSESA